MCRFITVIVPKDCRIASEGVLKRLRGYVSEGNNDDLSRIAPTDSIQLLSPKAGCDCSSVLDNSWILKRSEFDHDALATKWRRMGWSEAKIERGLADKAHGKATTTHRGPSDSFEQWENVISALLAVCTRLGPIGLFLHDYGGSIDNESMTPAIRRITATVSLAEAIQSIKEDELLLFDSDWARARELGA